MKEWILLLGGWFLTFIGFMTGVESSYSCAIMMFFMYGYFQWGHKR